MISNIQRDAILSSITPEELGRAMSALDLSAIPVEKRKAAIKDRLATIMTATILDRDKALDIAVSQKLHRIRGL